ncbi:spore coat protein [Bacillus sp. A301a_S52]|nr:spore coat protein [Bacillus sp. A301a_S52]
MNYAAHGLLETQEALRTKSAEIEQHGAFVSQCRDQQLKSILKKHQQLMMNGYQQGINLLNGRGAQVTHRAPAFNGQNTSTGMQEQMTMSAPSMSTQGLSDQTIATLALNTHKTGSMMGMQWANECVDPQIRMYHVNGANMCQEMAYEIWSWMNQNGYYQPATFGSQQITQMTGMFQPMTNQNTQMTSQMNTNHMQ